jgi:hypothetical protein
MKARYTLLGMVALLAPGLWGCPSSFCLLTVNGQCELSNCGRGEQFDTQRQVCTCEPGRLVIGGACLNAQEAKQYCGKGAFWGPRGCAPIQCPAGQILDLETEQCGQKTVACAAGTTLVVNGGQAACVPAEQSCNRDEYYSPQGCQKLPTCPGGYEFDTTARTCVLVTKRPQKNDDRASVDVQAWGRANLGQEGGQGSQALCGPLAKKPLAFGVQPGGSIRVVANLALTFPGGLTDAATIQSIGTVEASQQPVTAKGALELQAAAEALMANLRAQQGRASLPGYNTTVKCLITNAAPPQVIPSTGGA